MAASVGGMNEVISGGIRPEVGAPASRCCTHSRSGLLFDDGKFALWRGSICHNVLAEFQLTFANMIKHS